MKIIPVQTFPYYSQSQNINFAGKNKLNNIIISRIQLETLLMEGKSVKEIASLYGINEQRIYKLIKLFSLKTPRRNKYPLLNDLKQKFDSTLPDLIKQGKSINEISQLISENKNTIIKWLKINLPEGLRAIKKEQHLNFLKSNYSDEEIAGMIGIKSTSVRNMRYQLKISRPNPEKELNEKLLNEYIQTSTSANELSELIGWRKDKTRRYIKKYQLQETLDNNLKNSILDLVNQGFGKYEAAQKLNMAEPTLKKLLKKFDMETVFEERRLNKINTILELKKQGLTNKQISQKTGIPLRTVSYYTNPQK